MIPHNPSASGRFGLSFFVNAAWRKTLCLLAAALALHWLPVFALDTERMLAQLSKRFGPSANRNFNDWVKLQDDAKNRSEAEKLRRVNEFFNRRIQFGDDIQIWGQSDYWATPLETLGRGAGDCEDFSIAKYFTLLNLGISNEQLRLVYVKARIGDASSPVQIAHMVLAYYQTPDSEPLILDNLITDLRPASRRPDLQPIFSFNSQGIWQGAGGRDAQGPGGTGRVSRWQDLLQRAHDEGFD